MTRLDTILDQPILMLSATDPVSIRTAVEGILITGAPGSGKTTCSGRQLAYGLLLTPNIGGLILTAKAEETDTWIRYAKACGREKDLIVFNAESGFVFDPMHYEWTRPGRGAGDLESVIDFFSTLISIGKKEVVGQGHDPFWERGAEKMMRATIKLLDLAGEPISIANMDKLITTMPTVPGQHDEESWQKESYCAALISRIRQRQASLTRAQWSDLDTVAEFVFNEWPSFDDRPRASLAMTWSGMADKFLYEPLKTLFCSGKCSFTPEDTTHRGKIVICDFPLLEYGHETGRTINVILKLIFQRAWLRRKLSESPNVCFIWQDEFQYFVTRRDNFFQQTCRGSRVAVVCLTQNILNLSEELGESEPGSKTKSFLGNLGLKIFHQQNDMVTATFAADQIGQTYRYLDSFNAGSGGPNEHTHTSVGGTRHLMHLIDPIEFTRLKKPDGVNPYAQAICYLSGQTFNATKTEQNPKGSNFMSVYFSRE